MLTVFTAGPLSDVRNIIRVVPMVRYCFFCQLSTANRIGSKPEKHVFLPSSWLGIYPSEGTRLSTVDNKLPSNIWGYPEREKAAFHAAMKPEPEAGSSAYDKIQKVFSPVASRCSLANLKLCSCFKKAVNIRL
jgi:hypothetical protein